MRRASTFGWLAACAVVCCVALGADSKSSKNAPGWLKGEWPQWRGPNRDGIAPDKGLLKSWPESGPPLLWQAKKMGTGWSSVAVAGGRAYTLGDRDGKEFVIAVNAGTGNLDWETEVSNNLGDGPRSTPTVDGDLMYVITPHGEIVCLATKNGEEKWRKHLEKDFGGGMMSSWKFCESPLVDGDRVICTPGGKDAAMVALDKMSGDVVWKTKLPKIEGQGSDGAGYSSVVISNGGGVKQYVQLIGRGVIGVRASDGELLWGYNKVANGTANIPTPIISGDFVFCSTGYGAGSALLKLKKAGKGVAADEVYFLKGDELQNHHGGMVLIGDHIYMGHGHNQGFPVCVEMKSGEIVWNQGRGPGEGSAAVIAADGNLYFRYQNGMMALIEATPKEYIEHGTFQIPECNSPSWAQPVVAGGKLYLREQDNLFCYDLKKK